MKLLKYSYFTQFISLQIFLLACVYIPTFTFMHQVYIQVDEIIGTFKLELIIIFLLTVVFLVLNKLFNKSKFILYVFLFLLNIRLIIRIIDALFIYSWGNHYSQMILMHINFDSVYNYLNLEIIIISFLAILLSFFILRWNYRLSKILIDKIYSEKLIYQLLIFLALFLYLINGSKKHNFYLRYISTEMLIAREIKQVFFPEIIEKLPENIKLKMENFDIYLDSIYIKDPLFKNNLSLIDSNLKQVNIIIYTMESVSQSLLSYYNNDYKELTPNIDAFFNDSNTIVHRNYYNSAYPTINGLISMSFSMQQLGPHGDFDSRNVIIENTIEGLGSILKKEGYSPYYISAADADFTQIRRLFHLGEYEIFEDKELKEFLKIEQDGWGYSDHEFVRFNKDFLLKKARMPFVLILSTMETHTPYHFRRDSKKYPHADFDILHSMHTADHAFGEFFEFYKKYFAKNSVLILTADHAPEPGEKYIRINKKAEKKYFSMSDKIPLGIYLPNKTSIKFLDDLATNVDLTPSILHLLNINIKHKFEGQSIFETIKRPRYFFEYNDVININSINNFKISDSLLSESEFSIYKNWRRNNFLRLYLNSQTNDTIQVQ